jgi:putative MFS transporter
MYLLPWHREMRMTQPSVLISTREDVYQAINEAGKATKTTNRSIIIGFIALGGIFVDAYDFTSLSIGTVQLKEQFHLTSTALGSVTASMAIGTLIGAMIGGHYTDKLGRLRMFMLDLVLFVVAAIGAAVSPNLGWLIAFRVLMGLGVGIDFPVALSYVTEYASSRRRPRFVNALQITWFIAATAGFLILLAIHAGGVTDALWRYAVGIGALPALVLIVLRYRYIDESPMWAASTGNLELAARILRDSFGINAEARPLAKADGYEARTAGTGDWRAVGTLFNARYLRRTVLVGFTGMTESMEYYALGFYLPAIIALIFGSNIGTVLWASAVFNVAGVVAAGLNLVTVNRLGLRLISAIGYVGVIVAMAVMGLFGSVLPTAAITTCLVVFIAFHSYGPGTVGVSMAPQSYPTSIRGIGAGFNQSMIRVGSICGFYLFPLLLSAIGLYHTTLLLLIVPVVGLAVTAAIKWEPVGADVESEDSPALVLDGI